MKGRIAEVQPYILPFLISQDGHGLRVRVNKKRGKGGQIWPYFFPGFDKL